MIFKKDLLDAINFNAAEIAGNEQLIIDLQKRVTELENNLSCEVPVKRAKRSGKVSIWVDEAKELAERNAMSNLLECMIEDTKKKKTTAIKSTNAKKQPRSKDGKFAKKK